MQKAHISETRMTNEIRKLGVEDPGEASRQTSQRPRLKVAELLAGHREAILEHNGQDYLLRITANGRLILTK